MTKLHGKNISISPFRRLIIDIMHFGQQVPTVTLDRRMNLASLVVARQKCGIRPSWTALFLKAYSIVSARQPVLRRCYLRYPWEHFYEHFNNVASFNISRRVNDEDVFVPALVCSPENLSLTDLDLLVRRFQEVPVEEISFYRRARRMSALPSLFRRWLMGAGLNWIGRQRCDHFGTFCITSVADRGAGLLTLVSLLTTTLHYGLLDDAGCLDVRLSFDHRVMDGGPAADALSSLEDVLLGEILHELESMADPLRAVA